MESLAKNTCNNFWKDRVLGKHGLKENPIEV